MNRPSHKVSALAWAVGLLILAIGAVANAIGQFPWL